MISLVLEGEYILICVFCSWSASMGPHAYGILKNFEDLNFKRCTVFVELYIIQMQEYVGRKYDHTYTKKSGKSNFNKLWWLFTTRYSPVFLRNNSFLATDFRETYEVVYQKQHKFPKRAIKYLCKETQPRFHTIIQAAPPIINKNSLCPLCGKMLSKKK